jgi:hypothetical protein
MSTPSVNEKIIINFGWQGPTARDVESYEDSSLYVKNVTLGFKNATTAVSVRIPENISPNTVRRIPFTCQKISGQETHPDFLQVTIERIRNLTISARISEEIPRGPSIVESSGRIRREKHSNGEWDRAIPLEVPEELEIGQTYSLVVTSDDLSLSARLLKEERNTRTLEDEKQGHRNEFQGRMRNMGEALIREGMQNLNLASRNGAGVVDSSSTTADVFAHGMRGVIRAGQQMHPDIRVPQTRPSTSPSDLDRLTVDELESRFANTFKKDKEFETQRTQAAMRGDIEKMNEILEVETANSQLLIQLGEALERKGITPQVPQSASFQAAASQAAQAQTEALRYLQEEACKVQ